MISSGIEKLGFSKWFNDKVDPNDLNSFEIARVMVVHKNNYIINNGKNDIFSELIGNGSWGSWFSNLIDVDLANCYYGGMPHWIDD